MRLYVGAVSAQLRRRLLDFAPGAVLLALGVAELAAGSDSYRGSTAGNAVFLAATCVALVPRRRHPAAALAAVFAIQAIWITAYYRGPQQPPFEPFAAGVVVCFALGLHADRRNLRIGLAAFAVMVAGGAISLATGGESVGNAVPALIWWMAAIGIGRLLHERQALVDLLGDRAARLERDRDRDVAQAAMEERTRIARELHDVIAHAVSLIVVQASAERRLLGESDAEKRTAETLVTIEDAGREALGELRRLLGVLRAGSGAERLAPQPGLDALPDLIDESRRSGQTISLVVEGDPVRLPPGLDLAAYRIVQEALTNARKHAPAAPATVSLRWHAAELDIEVVDSGNGRVGPGNGTGHGLIGMHERAALYGGSVKARPTGDGFRVQARLPIEQGAGA
jgi:signal transduction histidine kinase